MKSYAGDRNFTERKLALLLLAVGIILGIFQALGGSWSLPWLCPFKHLTGYPCPGCGMTKATKALMKGHLKEALTYNPNVFFLWAWVLFTALSPSSLYQSWKKRIYTWRLFEGWLIALLGWWLWRILKGG